MSKALQQLDPYYLDERRKEWQRYVEFFGKQLFEIVKYMPPPARVLDLKTGEWTMVNDEKWQPLIDKRIKENQDFLEKKFPELYEQR